MKAGTVLECNGNIYLVKEVHVDGHVVANICVKEGQELFVVPGMTMHISCHTIGDYKIIGEAEVA